MSFSKKVFRSGLSNILLNVVNMLIGLGLAPFVVHTLGDVQNGYWVIARMVFGYYGFVDFGVGLSIARFLSLSVGKKDHTEAKKIVQTGLAFILSIDALFLILCVAAYFGIGNLNFSGDKKLVQDLVLIVGFSILVILPGRVFAGVLTAHIRQDIIAWIGILNSVIRAILIVSFLSFGFGVRSLAIISGFIALLSSLLYYLTARRFMKNFQLYIPAFDKKVFSFLFKYGFSISLASVSDIIRWGAAPLIAATFFGAAFVTHFNVALSLGRYGVALIASSFIVMMPVFGQLVGIGDTKKLKRIFFQTLNLTILISVFMFGGLIVLGENFIGNWMGIEYQDAYPALALISCGLMIALMQNPIVTLMQGMGLAKIYAITNGAEAVLNVILCMILGRYGMIGFGLAFGVPMIIIKLFVQPWIILSKTGWSLKEFYAKFLSRFLRCLVGVVTSAGIVLFVNIGSGWILFLTKGLTYTFVYGIITLVFIMKKEERINISSRLHHFLPRKKQL